MDPRFLIGFGTNFEGRDRVPCIYIHIMEETKPEMEELVRENLRGAYNFFRKAQ